MGSIPSKESGDLLFSYYRGSYETGLIPLTKHFFGKECDDDDKVRDPGNDSSSQHDSSNLLEHSSHMQLGPDVRRELRRQLIQVRRDPAVLYGNGRDRLTMLKTFLHQLQDEKMSSNAEKKEVSSEEVAMEPSLAPQESVANTYPNDVYSNEDEVLNAIESFTGWDRKKIENELREKFWDIIPESNFSEEDLDNFLELVEERMYETDEDMVLDARYYRDTPNGPQAHKPSFNHSLEGYESDENCVKKLPSMFAPVPCALCLAYPAAKAREGCFPLGGRYINVIGFFGILSPEMQKAFKLVKIGDAEKTEVIAESGEHVLHLNTALLAAAGDRTLERVLALSAVMLRQQFHSASRTVLLNQRRSCAHLAPLNDREILSLIERCLPSPNVGNFFTPHPNSATEKCMPMTAFPSNMDSNSPLCKKTLVNSSDASPLIHMADDNEITFNYYERLHRLSVVIEMASNNYCALKCLTENLAFLHCQVRVDPEGGHAKVYHLPEASEHPPERRRMKNKKEKNGGLSDIIHEDIELKAGLKNCSSDSCTFLQKLQDADGSFSTELDSDPTVLEGVGKKVDDEASNATSLHLATCVPHRLSPESRVVLHMKRQYFAQASLWASGLLHFPQVKGKWVLYKLKGEEEHLRHTFQRKDELILDWRMEHQDEAMSYLGPDTPRLLAHLRCLQDETEITRSLPHDHWKRHVSVDGRNYALHETRYGTMFIGVRYKKIAAPKEEKKTLVSPGEQSSSHIGSKQKIFVAESRTSTVGSRQPASQVTTAYSDPSQCQASHLNGKSYLSSSSITQSTVSQPLNYSSLPLPFSSTPQFLATTSMCPPGTQQWMVGGNNEISGATSLGGISPAPAVFMQPHKNSLTRETIGSDGTPLASSMGPEQLGLSTSHLFSSAQGYDSPMAVMRPNGESGMTFAPITFTYSAPPAVSQQVQQQQQQGRTGNSSGSQIASLSPPVANSSSPATAYTTGNQFSQPTYPPPHGPGAFAYPYTNAGQNPGGPLRPNSPQQHFTKQEHPEGSLQASGNSQPSRVDGGPVYFQPFYVQAGVPNEGSWETANSRWNAGANSRTDFSPSGPGIQTRYSSCPAYTVSSASTFPPPNAQGYTSLPAGCNNNTASNLQGYDSPMAVMRPNGESGMTFAPITFTYSAPPAVSQQVQQQQQQGRTGNSSGSQIASLSPPVANSSSPATAYTTGNQFSQPTYPPPHGPGAFAYPYTNAGQNPGGPLRPNSPQQHFTKQEHPEGSLQASENSQPSRVDGGPVYFQPFYVQAGVPKEGSWETANSRWNAGVNPNENHVNHQAQKDLRPSFYAPLTTTAAASQQPVGTLPTATGSPLGQINASHLQSTSNGIATGKTFDPLSCGKDQSQSQQEVYLQLDGFQYSPQPSGPASFSSFQVIQGQERPPFSSTAAQNVFTQSYSH